MGLDWGGLSEIGVGLGARCVRAPLWGAVSSTGHWATGLGSWRNLECGFGRGMGEDVLFLFWVEVGWRLLVGSSGRWAGRVGRWLGWMMDGWMDYGALDPVLSHYTVSYDQVRTT